MGFLSKLLGGGAGAVGDLGKDVADIFTTSDRERLEMYEAETRRIELTQKDRAAQIELNKIEAGSGSAFNSGWRPFIGWTCGVGTAYHFILYPLVGPVITHFFGISLVDLDWQELSVLLVGMLGMGGIRSYEKVKGVAKK